MKLPLKDFRGQKACLSLMDFRAAPGDAVDRASHGMEITLEKNGKAVAILSSVSSQSDVTTILADGSIHGQMPLTYRRNLGSGGYGD